jgi:cation diffusion facilitator CzcD-associated flavoprotein CzcO
MPPGLANRDGTVTFTRLRHCAFEMTEHQVVVVGAGPSGVAAALAVKDAGIRPLVLDRAEEVGSSWRGRYDRLRLNTARPLSHLPDRRFPKGTPMFLTRDMMVEHVERHAHEGGIDLQLGTSVHRIDRDGADWVVHTSDREFRTPQVIVATGYENLPFIPDWPGRETFDGRLLHAHEYKNPQPFAGSKVLVVGPGCSGMEIAYDLADGGASKVWLSARTPPNILLRTGPGGLPGDFMAVALMHFPSRIGDAIARFGRKRDIGDLTEFGLPVPEEGVFTRLRRLHVAPAIVDREVIEAIKARKIEIVRGVESVDSSTVWLGDGASVAPDVVICATGYRRGLESLVGHLGVLDDKGVPRARGEEAPAPGLRFIGYVPRPGGLGYMSGEAKRAAKVISHELRRASASPPRPMVAAG